MSNMEELKLKNKDSSSENEIRPLSFYEYIGQEHIKEELEIAIKSSIIRDKPLKHMLFSGSPGLGKTTLAAIIAKEKNAKLHVTSAPIIEKPADLATLLMGLERGDILFIDEIHALNTKVEESLYTAIEDFKFDVNIENGSQSKLIRLDIEEFTLIGATTKPGSLTQPMRDRMPISHNLKFYTDEELAKIIKRTSNIIDVEIDDDAALEIARRSRSTARIANNLLERVADYAIVGRTKISYDLAYNSLNKMSIDKIGLSISDRKYLQFLYYSLENKPSGVKTISSYINEDERTIETVIEPFLIQKGLLSKTQRGRILTKKGIKYTTEEIKEAGL